MPETCAPAACARVSGAVMVTRAPPLPPAAAATTAVSSFAPLSIVMVWPALKPTALGDRDRRSRPQRSAAACGGRAGRADRRDDGGLEVRAGVDRDRLAGGEVRHAGDLDVGRAGGRRGRQGGGGLHQEVGAEAVGVERRPGSGRGSCRARPPWRPGPPRPAPGPRRCSRPCPDRPRAWRARGWRWSRCRSSCSAAIRRRWRRRPLRRWRPAARSSRPWAERTPPNHCLGAGGPW